MTPPPPRPVKAKEELDSPSPDCNEGSSLPTPLNHGHSEKTSREVDILPRPPPHPTSVVSVGATRRAWTRAPRGSPETHYPRPAEALLPEGPWGKVRPSPSPSDEATHTPPT